MSKKMELTQADIEEIIGLHQMHYGTRQIARRLHYSRKIVRRVLSQANLSPTSPSNPIAKPSRPSKLAPFHLLIEEKVAKGLTTSRILREIEPVGYQGGRTILATQVRQLRTTLGVTTQKTVKRRFETPPAQEMQIDWSPYLIPIATRTQKVHALGCLLCHSRKLFVHCFPDERQPTLLEGLAMAFEYFQGCAHRVVLDNMTTAVLGRYQGDGDVLWHPRFADFARHYGFKPFACKPKDPDRKGKKEKSFRLLWDDFLKGSPFASFDDLNARLRLWLDHTPESANLRLHGTTRRVPNEVYNEEKALLIALPEQRFAVYEQSVRLVDQDSTLSVRGTRYSVPAFLANRSVAVRLFAEHFEVLDAHGRLAWSRRYVEESRHGHLIIDPTHYATLRRRSRHNPERLDTAFLARFPTLGPLVRGLQRKMKSLAGIHLRALLRLVESYGAAHFLHAAEHAQSYRRFDARAVQRILEQRHGPGDDPAAAALTGGAAADLVNDVDGGALEAYSHLDGTPPQISHRHGEFPAPVPNDPHRDRSTGQNDHQDHPRTAPNPEPDKGSEEK